MTQESILLRDNKRLREAIQSLLDGMEQMPMLNEEIVEQVMRGDHTLECKIGGDEANISSWVAIARMALNPPVISVICPGCKNEIDPDVCHCGDVKAAHGSDHNFVPMGCDCGRAKPDDVPPFETK